MVVLLYGYAYEKRSNSPFCFNLHSRYMKKIKLLRMKKTNYIVGYYGTVVCFKTLILNQITTSNPTLILFRFFNLIF
jgi:hypothetical protein